MKRSIAYLPKRRQSDLHYLVKAVLEKIPQTEMIILYGSYATGKYVEYDERVEFGIRTTYMSDYDILVVTDGVNSQKVERLLDKVDDKYSTGSDFQTPVQFINEDIKRLNKCLSDGRYFYTQLKKDGILLYDSGKYKLARRRKLNYDEIKQYAEGYFEEKYKRAESFFRDANYAHKCEDYKQASFYLHQTCENLFYATRLTFTLQNPKLHNLAKLLNSVKKYSGDFTQIFPRETKEEKRLFDLLKAAYVQARYSLDFLVTKEDIDALIPPIEQLFTLVKRICEERIQEYADMNKKIK